MTEAKRLTPVDTGALRASGHVQKPVIRRGASKLLGVWRSFSTLRCYCA